MVRNHWTSEHKGVFTHVMGESPEKQRVQEDFCSCCSGGTAIQESITPQTKATRQLWLCRENPPKKELNLHKGRHTCLSHKWSAAGCEVRMMLSGQWFHVRLCTPGLAIAALAFCFTFASVAIKHQNNFLIHLRYATFLCLELTDTREAKYPFAEICVM